MEKIKLSRLIDPIITRALSDGQEHFVLSAQYMKVVFPNYYVKAENLPCSVINNLCYKIEEFALCFNIFNLNWVWCKASKEYPVYLTPDIVAFRHTNTIVSSEYMFYALNAVDFLSPVINEKECYNGCVANPRFLLSLELSIPSAISDTQYAQHELSLLSSIKDKIAEERNNESEALAKMFKEDIEDKVHLVAPYGNSIDNGLRKILQKLENGETISPDTEIYRIPAVSYIKTLCQKVSDQNFIIDSLSESYHGVVVPINFNAFFDSYVSMYENDLAYKSLGIEFSYQSSDDGLCLLFGKQDFKFMIDTIVRNAQRHGFSEFEGKKKINFSCTTDKDPKYATVSVANCGNRVSSDFTKELYIARGGKCGANAHTGRGGKWVYDTVKFFDGDVDIITDSPEWSFIVNLKIPFVYA